MKESTINVGIETYTIDETIHSEYYAYDDIDRERRKVSELIINTQEEQIREQLIKLGWTPPREIQ